LLEVLRSGHVFVVTFAACNKEGSSIKEGVARVSGILNSLRNQLVVLQGEVDQALGLVDEGLGSFGLKDAEIDRGKGNWCC
jgi:hypothetical protein